MRRYRDDDVTYVLVRCTSAAAGDEVRARILAQVPHVEVLTRGEFARRTSAYWMLRTGAGLTVVLIAAMGFCVSALVVSQTLYTITQGHLDHYATLLALGFSRLQLTTVVVIQALFMGVSGILGGTWLVMAVVDASVNTPVPVQVHVPVHLILCAPAPRRVSPGRLSAGAIDLSYGSCACIPRPDPVQPYDDRRMSTAWKDVRRRACGSDGPH